VHDEPDLCFGDDIRYDACLEVDADFRPTAGLGVQVIPESTYVVLPHTGPGNLLPCTYMRVVVDWVATGGSRSLATLPYYERYADCSFLDRPGDVRAEVQVRVDQGDMP
jgi:AraC family transcriptional regulator